MNESQEALIYSGAERHNVNCTKVIEIGDGPTPFRVYVVANESRDAQRRRNFWSRCIASHSREEAERFARSVSDGFDGAHYLGFEKIEEGS